MYLHPRHEQRLEQCAAERTGHNHCNNKTQTPSNTLTPNVPTKGAAFPSSKHHLPHSLRQSLVALAQRPNAVPDLFLCRLWAKSDIYTFKSYLKRKTNRRLMCNRNHIWPSKVKIFTTWSIRGRVLAPPPPPNPHILLPYTQWPTSDQTSPWPSQGNTKPTVTE